MSKNTNGTAQSNTSAKAPPGASTTVRSRTPQFADSRTPFAEAGWPLNGLIPLIPIGATLGQSSQVRPHQVGKIPGRYHAASDTWNGLGGGWSEGGLAGAGYVNRAAPLTAEEVAAWPTGQVGFQAMLAPAVDCDVEDEAAATLVLKALNIVASLMLGGTHEVRSRGGSPRWLMPFGPPADGTKPVASWFRKVEIWDPLGECLGAVEFKASGHYAVLGDHQSGGCYEWRLGIPQLTDLRPLDEALMVRFREQLELVLVGAGYEVRDARRKAPGVVDSGTDRDRETTPLADMPQLVSEEALEAFLAAIPCDRETIGDHNEAVKSLAAVAAVLGSGYDPDAPPACLMQWCCSYGDPDAEAEWLQGRWASFAGGVRQGVDGFIAWAMKAGKAAGGEVAMAAAEAACKAVRRGQAREEFADVPEDEDVDPDAGPPPTPTEVWETALEQAKARWVYRAPAKEWRDLAFKCEHVHDAKAMSDSKHGLALTEARFQLDKEIFEAKKAAGTATTQDRPKRKAAHTLLVDECRHVQSMTYEPGEGRFPKLGVRGHLLNSWWAAERPCKAEVIEDADIQPYLDALAWTFPRVEDRELFLDWACFTIQYPQQKIQWAPVLLSQIQGTGKDTALMAVQFGVGERNWSVIDDSVIGGAFTHWARAKVIYLKELPTSRKRDVMSGLKGFVAGAAGGTLINEKHVTPYMVPDRANWVFTTNHPDALDLTDDDRRFVIIECAHAKMPPDLVERVYAFFDLEGGKGGLYRVAEWLRRRQGGEGFNSGQPPEASVAKLRMRELSLQGTAGETLREQLVGDDGIWRNRTVLWSEEVKRLQVMARGQGQQKGTRREHTALALELAGMVKPACATREGRVETMVKGRALRATVYVRKGSAAASQGPLDMLRTLYAELRAQDDGDAAMFLEARPGLLGRPALGEDDGWE